MNSRDRVLITLNHGQPDRVPIFEFCINNSIGEYFLNKKVYLVGMGDSTKAAIEAEIRGKKEYRKFVMDSFLNSVELYAKAGIDTVGLNPAIFVTPYDFGLNIASIAAIYNVEIKKEKENFYKIISIDKDAPGFWNTCMYIPKSGTFQMISDNIKETIDSKGFDEGIKEFERYVGYLENIDLTKIPEPLKYGLDALEKAIEINNKKYNLFLLGFGDIEYPCFVPYHPLFLELMIINSSLVHRYMRATTNSVKAMIEIEIELGVDGILAPNDWVYRNGPMMSPTHFNEYMAPYLKELVDLTHKNNKMYIKHLDGRTYSLLDTLVNEVGIDAYHAIEPTAGMDILKVKKMYGGKITVIGNIDCGEILCNWTPGKINEEVKRIINETSPGCGHIFSSSNSIHNGVPVENFLSYINAVKKFGHYPINI